LARVVGVPIGKIPDVLRHVPIFQIAAPAEFVGDVFRGVTRPAFDRIESNDPKRLIALAGARIFDGCPDIRLAPCSKLCRSE
jgi:hypothetical protein